MKKRSLKIRERSYHLIGRTKNREPFSQGLDVIWRILIVQLNMLTLSHRIRVRSLVLMGNHFHVLISTPWEDVDRVSKGLKYSLERMCKNGKFLDDIKAFEIKHPIYFQYVYKYNYRNPVSAGLCDKVEDYPYTSINNVMGKKPELFMIFDNMNLIHDPVRMLSWLNEPCQYPPEIEELNMLFS